MAKLALLALPALVLSSCSRLYVPPQNQMPLFEREGDTRVGAALGSSGLELQGSYALTDEIGAFASSSLSVGGGRVNSHQYIEGGGAYYFSPVKHVRLEALGGIGLGRSAGLSTYAFEGEEVEYRLNSGFQKYFLQSNAGFSDYRFDAGVSARLSHLRFQIRESPGAEIPDDLDRDTWALEPGVMFRYKMSNYQIQANLGAAVALENSGIEMQPVHFSIGVQYQLYKGIPQIGPGGNWDSNDDSDDGFWN